MHDTPESSNTGQAALVSVCLETAKEYSEQGLHEEAVKVLKAALNLDPDNTDILTNLASAYCEQKNFDDALPLLQHAHRLDPTDYYAVAMMGHAFARTERWRAAIEQLEILYPLNQVEALQLFRNVFASFTNLLFDRIIVASRKNNEQGRESNPAA